MANTTLSDHIITFADALDAPRCRKLIERFDASAAAQELCESEGGYRFTQLDVSEHWHDEHERLAPIFFAYFTKYQRAVNARFWPPTCAFEHLRLKRYLPNGRDSFPPHVDVMAQAPARRFMTAIIYLNNVPGGETVFPELHIAVSPETGKLIAFPPLWLFPHAGLPPRQGAKYILHTYLCYPS